MEQQQVEAPRRSGRFSKVEIEAREASIRRMTVDDIDDWLLGRLNDRWPGYDDRTWIGKFNGFGMSNDILAITNEEAVAVFFSSGHLMTGKPVVMEAFLFSREAKINRNGEVALVAGSPEEKRAYDLYNHAFDWAKSRGAVRTICGTCSDMNAYGIRNRRSCPLLADVR
jgi:hypothetical protein